jgi:hypothetical protein
MEHWAAAGAELADEDCASLWQAELSTLVVAGGGLASECGSSNPTIAVALADLARVPPREDFVCGRVEPLYEGEDADSAAGTANLGPIVPVAASVEVVATLNVPPSVVDVHAKPQATIARAHLDKQLLILYRLPSDLAFRPSFQLFQG